VTARKFFYVCAGLFLLALTYHLGASTATAQAGSPISGFTGTGDGVQQARMLYVMTLNGDVYVKRGDQMSSAPSLLGNFWSGGTTPALQESWGFLKARYAPSHAPTSQTPTDK
jgi:hypothetical protein